MPRPVTNTRARISERCPPEKCEDITKILMISSSLYTVRTAFEAGIFSSRCSGILFLPRIYRMEIRFEESRLSAVTDQSSAPRATASNFLAVSIAFELLSKNLNWVSHNLISARRVSGALPRAKLAP